jgi:serine O-acetyltransferase
VFNKINVIFGRCVIGRGADFGPDFVILHSFGVFINSNVRGGSRVTVEHRITVGAEKDQSPSIGDDVFIGVGAVILGEVRIGNGARIGANAVVVRDVPDGVTAVGVPARPLTK